MGMRVTEQLIDGYFSHCSESKATCRIYRAAYRRFQAQVPESCWDDLETVLRYRGFLKKSMQGVFGVMFGKLHAECGRLGVPCVDPKQLRWQFMAPHPIAANIRRLSVYLSYAQLAELQWYDVKLISGAVYLGRVEIPENVEDDVASIREYYWNEVEPPLEAPVLALSYATRLTAISPEMVETIVKDMDRTNIFGVESAFAYEAYRELAKLKVSCSSYEEMFKLLHTLCLLPEKEKEKGRKTLPEAKTALENRDAGEFFRLLRYAAAGSYEKRMLTLQESAAILASKSLLPKRPPLLALNDKLE